MFEQFVAWDGEGQNIKGQHRLILLANSLGKSVVDKKKTGSFTYKQWLPFLCDQTGTNVWFSFGYDMNMVFKDLDEESAIRLFQEQRRIDLSDDIETYKIKYIPKKILVITNNNHTYTHYDTFGFFQTGFVKSLEQWKIKVPEIITQGKIERSHFEDVDLDFIEKYNSMECDLLVQLMQKLYDCIQTAQIPQLRSWHGAGAIASTFLKTWNFTNHKTTIKPTKNKQMLFNARKYAYFGGRSELFYRGQIHKPIFRYDINSAYPNAFQYLPSLHNKQWYYAKPNQLKFDDFALVHVKWKFKFDTRVGALPFRQNDNMIIFCRSGEGWYHNIEVQHAIRAGYKIQIIEAYVLERPYEYFVIDKVEPFADFRLQLKRAKDLGHIPIKLGLNAIYGKLAQRPTNQENLKTKELYVKHGTYTELFYAGYITAFTRAQLLAAMNPDTVIMCATDGIFSTTELNVEVGEDLGQWERTVFDDGIFMLSGLYAVKTGNEWSIKTRGYSNMTWDKFKKIYKKQIQQEAVTTQERRFISMKLGLRAKDAYKKCEFQNVERYINWNNNPKRIFEFIEEPSSDSIAVDHPIDQKHSKIYQMLTPLQQILSPELEAMTDSIDPDEI